MVDKIRDLSVIEKDNKDLSPDKLLEDRETKSKPIIDEIHEWLLNHKDRILPSGSLGKAITYTLNLWVGLNVFLTDPLVPMTTNLNKKSPLSTSGLG